MDKNLRVVGFVFSVIVGVASIIASNGSSDDSNSDTTYDPDCFKSHALPYKYVEVDASGTCKLPRNLYVHNDETAAQCAAQEGWVEPCEAVNLPWCDGEAPPRLEEPGWACNDNNQDTGDLTCGNEEPGEDARSYTLYRFISNGCAEPASGTTISQFSGWAEHSEIANSEQEAKECASEDGNWDVYNEDEVCRYFLKVCDGSLSLMEGDLLAPSSAKAKSCAESIFTDATATDVSSQLLTTGSCLSLSSDATWNNIGSVSCP